MNHFIIYVIGYVVGMCVGVLLILGYKDIHNIDLPEEYTQISQDYHKPDTLIGFYMNNKLHIEFIPKNK